MQSDAAPAAYHSWKERPLVEDAWRPSPRGSRRGSPSSCRSASCASTSTTSSSSRGGVIGYALPLGPEEAQAEWSIWMWNNGGDWKSGDKWTINSDKNVQTLQFLAGSP